MDDALRQAVPAAGRFAARLSLAALRRSTYFRRSTSPHIVPADPFAPRGELPDPASRAPTVPVRAPGRRRACGPSSSRTRSAVADLHERRSPRSRGDGRLCVFLPPVAELEDYLDLIAAVEDASAELGVPLHLEGYEPPKDPRLNVIKVTPDPGVIEVNIQPASSWNEMRAITEGLYDDARHTRLVTEKFMLDGRHTGTGGGNHVVLGGARAGGQPVPAAARPAAQPDHVIGSIIRRCRICSRACSSARRARRRGSTKLATIRSTSSSSRSRKSRSLRSRRHGSSIGCSATC